MLACVRLFLFERLLELFEQLCVFAVDLLLLLFQIHFLAGERGLRLRLLWLLGRVLLIVFEQLRQFHALNRLRNHLALQHLPLLLFLVELLVYFV